MGFQQESLDAYTETDPTDLTVGQLVNRGIVEDGEEALALKRGDNQ